MVEGEILSFFSYDNDPHFLPYSGVLMLRGLKFETDGGHEIDGYMCTCIYVCGDMVHACGDMVHACGDMSACMWGHVCMHVGTCLHACGDMSACMWGHGTCMWGHGTCMSACMWGHGTCMWGHVYMHVGTCLHACGDMSTCMWGHVALALVLHVGDMYRMLSDI